MLHWKQSKQITFCLENISSYGLGDDLSPVRGHPWLRQCVGQVHLLLDVRLLKFNCNLLYRVQHLKTLEMLQILFVQLQMMRLS